MNANELMIGDYVYDIYGNKAIVRKLDAYNEHAKASGVCIELVEGAEEGKTYCLYGEIEPIPLTSEILKKNGWSRYGALCSGNGCTITVWSEDLFYFSCSKTHNDAPSELISCHIHYVHELQHALRLAGINKEIVL